MWMADWEDQQDPALTPAVLRVKAVPPDKADQPVKAVRRVRAAVFQPRKFVMVRIMTAIIKPMKIW